jgi:o-succinylbenzoate---CoA ligase
MPCPLRAAAVALPGEPAIVGADGTVTFGELDRRVSATAQCLEELGLGSGGRLALYLPKDQRYFVLLLALIRAGGVACPIGTSVPPRGVAPLLRRAACDALVSEDEMNAGVRTLRPEMLLSDEPAQSLSEPLHLSPDQPATIVFTSGSTGAPKAVLHTFGNHACSALGSNANIALAPGDRWLHSLPLYHVGGLSILFRCLLAGAAIVIPEPGTPLGRAIAEGGATHVSLVSTQLLRLLKECTPLDGLKAVLLGGGPVPASLLDEALARGLPIHTSYGLTEMASQVTATPPDASAGELRTSGRVLPHRELSISENAEILVRGETLFAGYVEDGDVDLPLDSAGWFHTKDLGSLDADSYLHVRGRKDNLFISGGQNVQPEEIEAALCRLKSVEEAVVVPVPDPEFGARPIAFVRMSSETGVPEDLREELEPILPRFKIPAAFYGWSGGMEGMKVDRALLQERARQLTFGQ